LIQIAYRLQLINVAGKKTLPVLLPDLPKEVKIMSRMLSAVLLIGSILLLPLSVVEAATKQVGFDFGSGTHKANFSVTTKYSPSFHLVLRIRNDGTRAILSYRKSTWRRSQPLIDTKTYGCDGAAGSSYCEASYEPLPKGTYVFTIHKTGKRPTHIDVTLDW
jgi:hypothetical protein